MTSGHRQHADAFEIGSRVIAQLHADRNLAVGEIELGETGLDVARRRDARHRAERFRRDAQFGGAIRQRPDHDLRLHQAGAAGDVADPGQRAQIAFDGRSRTLELVRIVAGQRDLHLGADLRAAEGHARARNVAHALRGLMFELLLREVALVRGRELDREAGAAHVAG